MFKKIGTSISTKGHEKVMPNAYIRELFDYSQFYFKHCSLIQIKILKLFKSWNEIEFNEIRPMNQQSTPISRPALSHVQKGRIEHRIK